MDRRLHLKSTMKSKTPLQDEFDSLLGADDNAIDLARASLLIARVEYPELAVDDYIAKLDEMAAVVTRRLNPNESLAKALETLNHYLFVELGFEGNLTDYFDPRNSYLNQVLERRLGIPITMCILYLEMGRRLGLHLQGVSFPGHFLVKFRVADGDVVLDPFLGGVSLSRTELVSRLEDVLSADEDPEASLAQHLAPASNREILSRMLRNLKGIYLSRDDLPRALRTVNHILVLNPDHREQIRERARLYERLECSQAAARDYQRYLELTPNAADAEELREKLVRLFTERQNLH
jgi:regulator of sirC expression with transglutaminase-like and TPR domain